MSLDTLQQEHERLRKKLDKDWPTMVIIVNSTFPELTNFSQCPVCKAIVIDVYEHREWHLRCLQ